METVITGALRPGCEQRCPACAHRHLSAADSRQRKSAALQQKLADWADRIAPMCSVEGEARWAYRDRACLTCEWRQAGWQIGMRRGDSVIAIPDCPVHSERINTTVHILLQHLPAAQAFPLVYFVQSGAQLVLVLKSRELPEQSWLSETCRNRLRRAGVEGVWLHLHPAAGKKIFGKPGWYLAWGQARSCDAEGFEYGPMSFQQPVQVLYEQAVQAAEDFLQPSRETLLVDLYCGRGTTLRRWSDAGAAATGVELGAEACACAAVNAPGAVILRGKCAQRLPQLNSWAGQSGFSGKSRLLYLNPPRTGLEDEVASWITVAYRPQRIAYLSCSAATLRRDLLFLAANGYRVERITAYDFFPHTWHVETLTFLTRADER